MENLVVIILMCYIDSTQIYNDCINQKTAEEIVKTCSCTSIVNIQTVKGVMLVLLNFSPLEGFVIQGIILLMPYIP